MGTEPDTPIASFEPSRTERLLESLSRVSSFSQFWQTIRGYEDEVVEDAIFMQDRWWRRQTLTAWFEGDAEASLPEIALDRFLSPDSVRELAGFLRSCCKEVFDILRQSIPSTEAFRQAARLLSRERRAIIRQWVVELNNEPELA